MGIIEFIVLAVVLGIIVWLVTKAPFIPQPIKTVIVVAVVVCLVLILIRAMGVLDHDTQIPKLSG